MSDIVRLHAVSKRYDDLEAVKRLSLSVASGEFLTLLGSSGCGKTTTLRLISGFEIADEGEIYIDGTLVNATPPYRREVNTVFQTYALFPHLDIFDNIAYGLSVRKKKKDEIQTKVHDMLDRVRLSNKAHNLPSQLSGGQKQRVALARALINEPKVLLLDEPLGALDAKLRRSMQLELKTIQESLGITFIYVTHDQEEAMVMSDRVAVMNEGLLVQVGSPREIFERPIDRFVAEFTGTENFFDARIADASPEGHRLILSNGSTVRAKTSSVLSSGTPVTVAVRPQQVRVAANGTAKENENILSGTLVEIIYVGALVRLVFDIGTGARLQAENLPENFSFDFRMLSIGDAMQLELPPQALSIYEVGK